MGRLQQGLGLLGEPQVVAVLPERDKPLPRLAHAEQPPAADDAMPGQVKEGAADHTVATLVVPADHVTPQGQHVRKSVRQTETQRACVCVCTNARARGASAGKASLAAAARGAAGAQRVRVALRRARYRTHTEAMASAGIHTQAHRDVWTLRTLADLAADGDGADRAGVAPACGDGGASGGRRIGSRGARGTGADRGRPLLAVVGSQRTVCHPQREDASGTAILGAA
jgi:hypothetical protein